MKAYEAVYAGHTDNGKESGKVTRLIGARSLVHAARKADGQQDAEVGELIELKLTDKVIL
jgi:hypothetical protein